MPCLCLQEPISLEKSGERHRAALYGVKPRGTNDDGVPVGSLQTSALPKCFDKSYLRKRKNLETSMTICKRCWVGHLRFVGFSDQQCMATYPKMNLSQDLRPMESSCPRASQVVIPIWKLKLNGHSYMATGKWPKDEQQKHPDGFFSLFRQFSLVFDCFCRAFWAVCFWPFFGCRFSLSFAPFACCHLAAAIWIPLTNTFI